MQLRCIAAPLIQPRQQPAYTNVVQACRVAQKACIRSPLTIWNVFDAGGGSGVSAFKHLSHEFIVVLGPPDGYAFGGTAEYIVDPRFREQFDIPQVSWLGTSFLCVNDDLNLSVNTHLWEVQLSSAHQPANARHAPPGSVVKFCQFLLSHLSWQCSGATISISNNH